MDMASVIGLVVSLGFLIYGILSGGEIGGFIDMPSVYIVFGGSIGAVVICCTAQQIKNTGKLFKIAFSRKQDNPLETIDQMLSLSYIARKEGLLSLENKADEVQDPFLKKGILLAVDGMESQVIRDVLGGELDALEQRHKEGRDMLDVAAAIFPAFGMIGTLIGLINMLKDLSEVGELGPQMSIALVTTFYGVIMSNIVFIPMSRKLKAKTEQEVLVKEMIIEGVVSIQAGENTRFVEQKLASFLSSKQKEALAGRGKNE